MRREAARKQAQQVADRFHVLLNLSKTLKSFFLNKQAQLDALVQKPSEDISEEEAINFAGDPPPYESVSLLEKALL